MTLYYITLILTCAACLVCAFRAPLLATSFLPALLLIVARKAGLVDISSASHPLRLVVPLVSLSLAMLSGWLEARRFHKYDLAPRKNPRSFSEWWDRHVW